MRADLDEVPERTGARRNASRLFRAIIAADQSEQRQATITTRVFVWFCSGFTVVYIASYLIASPPAYTYALTVNFVALAVYGVGLFLIGRGRQLAAAALTLGTATVQMLLCAGFFGWSVGFHLYYLAVGQLVFMAFTDSQKLFRWLYVTGAFLAFGYCQLFLDPEHAVYQIGSSTRTLLFSANTIGAGFVVYVLAAISHFRAREAQYSAHSSAARAEYLANTDALTGLANRRPVVIELERLSRPDAGPFCVGIADLDGFKALNDTFGHECGDRVLSTVGRSLRKRVRVTDIVGRWGGEEFILVLPDSELTNATALMERLRADIAELKVTCGNHIHTTTASFGVADGDHESVAFRVVKRADDAMYDAKNAGRNAVRSRPLASFPDLPTGEERSTRSLRVRGPEV